MMVKFNKIPELSQSHVKLFYLALFEFWNFVKNLPNSVTGNTQYINLKITKPPKPKSS